MVCHTTLVLAALAAAGCAAPEEVQASRMLHHSTPEIVPADDGMVTFRAVRKVSADQPEQHRTATLTIHDGEQMILKTSLKPTTLEDGTLIYEFDVAKQFLDGTRLKISEKDADKMHILGGGHDYEFSTVHPLQVVVDEIGSGHSRGSSSAKE